MNSSPDEENQKIVPKKLGISCHSRSLTLKYEVKKQTRYRVMPVKILNKFGPLERVILEMKSNHKNYLKDIPDIRIEKMLRILQEIEKGAPLAKALKLVTDEFTVDPHQDLNKLSDEELTKKKMLMEKTFLKNQLKNGDEDFVYDLQVNFPEEEKIDAGWDSGSGGDDFWI